MEEKPGYVFKPTDKELLYYLRRKLRREEPLGLDVFKECDIYGDKDPWELFDKTSTESFYVLTKLKRKSKSRIERTAGCGTWNNRRSDEIKDGSKKIVGFDRYFVFQVKDASSTTDIIETKGYWTMHEFSLLTEQLDDYVLCVISNGSQEAKAKKRKLNERQENHEVKKMRVTSTVDNIDFDDKKDNGEEASVPPSNLISKLEPAASSDLDNLPLSNLITDQPSPALYMEPTSMSHENYTAYDNGEAYVPPEPTSELEPAFSLDLDNLPLSTLITDQTAPALYMEPMSYENYTANEACLPQSSFNMEQWTPMMLDFDPNTIEAI